MLCRVYDRVNKLETAGKDSTWRELGIVFLYDLGEALVAAGLPKQAEMVLESLKDDRTKDRVWLEPITTRDKASFKERAEALQQRPRTLEMMLEADQWEERLTRKDLSSIDDLETVRGIEKQEINAYMDDLLYNSGKLSTEAQQWEQAQMAWQTIRDPYKQNRALHELVDRLIEVHEWQRAKHAAHTMKDPKQTIGALSKLGRSLAEASLLLEAEEVWKDMNRWVHTTEDMCQKVWEAGMLARALEQTRMKAHAEELWIRAEKLAGTIGITELRDQALYDLTTHLLQARRQEQAGHLLYSVTNEQVRDSIIAKLWSTRHTASIHKPDTPEISEQPIYDAFQRAWGYKKQDQSAPVNPPLFEQEDAASSSCQGFHFTALYEEACLLATRGEYEYLLSRVQSQLIWANTRREVIYILLLMEKFIELQPELAESFYMAFYRADSFFEER